MTKLVISNNVKLVISNNVDSEQMEKMYWKVELNKITQKQLCRT